MINCIYHPTYPMRVVNNEDYETMLSSGEWFKHPNEAKEVRIKYEKQIRRDQRKGSRKGAQDGKDAGTGACIE